MDDNEKTSILTRISDDKQFKQVVIILGSHSQCWVSFRHCFYLALSLSPWRAFSLSPSGSFSSTPTGSSGKSVWPHSPITASQGRTGSKDCQQFPRRGTESIHEDSLSFPPKSYHKEHGNVCNLASAGKMSKLFFFQMFSFP